MKKNTKITIYSSSLCGYCYRAKSLLISKNIDFQEIDIDEDFTKKKEMVGSDVLPGNQSNKMANVLDPTTGVVHQTNGITLHT